MRQAIVIYATGLASFVVLDGVWLGLMVPRLYKPAMGDLVAQPFQPLPAIAFYLIYGIGLAVFAIMPALSAGKLTTAFVYGGLFGLVAYATYDLTNQATLRGWPPSLPSSTSPGARSAAPSRRPSPISCCPAGSPLKAASAARERTATRAPDNPGTRRPGFRPCGARAAECRTPSRAANTFPPGR